MEIFTAQQVIRFLFFQKGDIVAVFSLFFVRRLMASFRLTIRAEDSNSDLHSESPADVLVLEHYRAAVLELTRQV